MPLTRRLIAARTAILVALLASAALTVDHVRPGPGYCPLEKACDQAKASELGTLAGVPTSILGMVAFTLLLLLSLPARAAARRICLIAASLAIASGLGFLLYQAVKLGTFCPLCVVADTAAVVGGVLLIIDVLFRPARWWRPGESTGAKVAWALGGALVMLAPFAWPAEQAAAGFEDAVELADTTFDELAEPETAPGSAGAADPEPAADDAEPPEIPLSHVVPGDVTPEVPAMADAPSNPPPPPPPPVPADEVAPPAEDDAPAAPAAEPTPPVEPAPDPAPEPQPTPPPTEVSTSAPAEAPTPAEKPSVRVVAYLNAYCPHCRKMHRRLERVLAASAVPVKHRRIYAWASADYPLWARACAFARTRGLEEALFEALMETRSDSKRNVLAAAQKVGLDTKALARALAGPPPSTLIRDRQLSRTARLKGLPTFDIGRRRLTGEHSEGTLAKALSLAAEDARDTSN